MITIKPNNIKLNNNEIKLDSNTNKILEFLDKIEYAPKPKNISSKVYTQNHFISMLHRAYSEHYSITISPDDFWYYIAQGFARHINLNAEKYRKCFVNFEGKQEIVIERHHFIQGKENDWPGVFDDFSKEIGERVGKTKDLIVANYTTTGPVEKIAFELTLMDTMQQYFNYKVLTLCGIPEINILGTKSDWQDLKARANIFIEYDLDWWIDRLNPVLDNIIKSFDGIIVNSFWNSIYKHQDKGSGGPKISGWITELFPYVQNGKNEIIVSPIMNIHETYKFDHLSTSNFLSSIVQVPFIWDYLGNEIKLDFTAGHFGYTQNKDGSLAGVMDWGIIHRENIKTNKQKIKDEEDERKYLEECKERMQRFAEEQAERANKKLKELAENYKYYPEKAKDPNYSLNKGSIKRLYITKKEDK